MTGDTFLDIRAFCKQELVKFSLEMEKITGKEYLIIVLTINLLAY